MKIALARAANRLYWRAPRLYRLLYTAYKRWSDRAERALLASRIRPGMTVLDVGANIGVYTQFLASLVGPTGRVLAFEPEPRNFEMLRQAVTHLPQVTPMQAAVGAAPGTLRLFVATDLNVDHHTYDDGDGRPSVEVPSIALDEHLAAGTRVDFIKMDIQGAEIDAIIGARRLIRENDRLEMLLEYWPYGLERAGHTAQELLSHLASAGFEWVPTDPTQRVEGLPIAADRYINLHVRRR